MPVGNGPVEEVQMHSVLTTEEFAALGQPYLVYVRPVSAASVMGMVSPEQIAHFELTPEVVLYGVFRCNGEQLAVLTDKEAAIAAAEAHDLIPVSVH